MAKRWAWLLVATSIVPAVALGCGKTTSDDQDAAGGSAGIGGTAADGTNDTVTRSTRSTGRSGSAGADSGDSDSATREASAGASDGAITTCHEPTQAVEVLQQGWWLCGWSGGLDHYAWMHFGPGDLYGTLSILDATCATCSSYFGCSGIDGEFTATSSLRLVSLTLPSTCGDRDQTIWEVAELCPSDGFPPGSSAYVTLKGPKEPLRCHRYPLDQCDPTVAGCPVPGW